MSPVFNATYESARVVISRVGLDVGHIGYTGALTPDAMKMLTRDYVEFARKRTIRAWVAQYRGVIGVTPAELLQVALSYPPGVGCIKMLVVPPIAVELFEAFADRAREHGLIRKVFTMRPGEMSVDSALGRAVNLAQSMALADREAWLC